jgi:hypothetical protein
VSTINCLKGGGTTAYANALEQAQAELNLHGRSNVQDVIVFLSDGAANTGPTYLASNSPYRTQPCHQGVTSAAAIKGGSSHTIIYSIGYDLDAANGGANKCENSNGNPETPTITAYTAISQIASDSTTFFNKPDPGQLNSIYAAIAADVSGTRLLDDNTT